jgi:hypothetical protein
MKSMVFDAGSVISLTTSGLLFILKELRQVYGGKFLITYPVKRELIDKPLDTKKFKFEAIQIMKLIEEETLEVYKSAKLRSLTHKLLDTANNSFIAKGEPIKIVHIGEISSVAACILLKSDALVVDERTTRVLLENPNKLSQILSHHLDTDIHISKKNIEEFVSLVDGLRAIRSIELAAVAYENGILNKLVPDIPYGEELLLDSILWSIKMNGCSIGEDEIEEIIRMESKLKA